MLMVELFSYSLSFVLFFAVVAIVWAAISMHKRYRKKITNRDTTGFFGVFPDHHLTVVHNAETRAKAKLLQPVESAYSGNWSPGVTTSRTTNIILILAIVAIAVFLLSRVIFFVLTFSPQVGSLRYCHVEDGYSVDITGMYGPKIVFDSITGISLEETFPGVEKRIRGIKIGNLFRGDFILKDTAKARILVVNSDEPPFLYIYTTDGLIVLNHLDAEGTERTYNHITSVKRHWS